ncbi:DUF5641 domain-containing protein [Trichonephila clavata]|uniref:DUF5641 domain-containing protein n=1 Tax=Trichonephila clavata TaxID=2740835 RepID=A0A8X6FE47_TRICU|nr:DUF5641 domain-containing protein [Trichonephila clavata]
MEKAFLMLSVAPKDRDYLRFYFPCNEKQLVYRHCRVVFGVSSSPYLLNASIMHLLENCSPEYKEVAQKLKPSFYVDNCVAGVFSVDEMEIFVENAKLIMTKGCFNLRTFESNVAKNRCSDTTDIDELSSRVLRKRRKFRIKLLSNLRQRFRKEYLGELIQKQNDNRVREPRVGEIVLIGDDNKKRLSWPIAKIIELIPGRDGEIRTVRLKTQHGTVIRPVQRIFPLEVQAIANNAKGLKEESNSVQCTKPENVLNTNDVIVKKYTSSGRLIKEPKRLDLLNYKCYRFETLPKSQRWEYVVNRNDLC